VDSLLPLVEAAPGIGHNRAPEAVEALERNLAESYADLVARFVDLELGCTRVPEIIDSALEAGLVADFVAQCQTHIRRAERAHKEEKAPFLNGGRAVDAFFKRRCEKLDAAVSLVLSRLKTCYDRMVDAEAVCHASMVRAAEAEACRATDEEGQHRQEAERLAREARTAEERRRAGRELALAEVAAARAQEASARAATPCGAPRIVGDYGASAYVSHSWSFEVSDLARVPRSYLSLDNDAVRSAITKAGVREIPGLRIFQSESLRVRGAA
jgi:hypothetical protein